jgi:hypothetical protein
MVNTNLTMGRKYFPRNQWRDRVNLAFVKKWSADILEPLEGEREFKFEDLEPGRFYAQNPEACDANTPCSCVQLAHSRFRYNTKTNRELVRF